MTPRAGTVNLRPAGTLSPVNRVQCQPPEVHGPIVAQVRRIGSCMIFVAALLLAACATQKPVPASTGGDVTFFVPYVYEGLGVGDGEVEGVVELPKDGEERVVSRAIVLALQELQNSIVVPDLGPGEALPQKRLWKTDRAPIPQSQIVEHNNQYPGMALPPRYYSLEYHGEYVAERRQLIFRISALLYEQAYAADPRKYNQKYSGKFFVDVLEKLIREKLQAPTKDEPV